MSWLKQYGDTEGPLGFPMRDADAKALDDFLRSHPDAEYQRALVEKATADLSPGERADVSWIQTEAIDRYGEIVLASGFDDTQFKANPIVTLNHDYTRSPVGTSAWRLRLKADGKAGVKAKTVYPPRPAEWDPESPWPSDTAWSLVKSGLMAGKSIGFVSLQSHAPTDEEVKKRPELQRVRRIVDRWLLVEYCCCWMPVNPDAVVEVVAKALVSAADLRAFGIEPPPKPEAARPIPHTTLDQVERRVAAVAALDLKARIDRAVAYAIDRFRGRP